ncbi:hypothetical protein SBOR_9017 [Sclerotinia borealis F-4128]|uniref:Uncharacterized protein n=1 Tax=Sclerotinia borealis (strain F-4128) TaxID=1432307 RepID=W9C4F7_SCLBF|nr:hypothetical protein SBOR_9017 [Sclerotinia borealis F-4128]
MPHVVSEMQTMEKPQQSYNLKRTMMKTSVSQDNLRPFISPRRQNTNGTPTLSLLVTPQHAWNYTSGRRQLNHISPDRVTPLSAVDSVFELSSAMKNGSSSNSAISSFIAELEDTSPGAVKPPNCNVDPNSPISPTLSVSSNSPLSPKLSLHATTAIEAINDFEAENKRLLERVLAAENTAKILEKQNFDLRRKVNYCMEQHRPKTAPSQRTSQNPNKRVTGYITTTPLSAFNTMMDQVEAEYLAPIINDPPTPLPRRKSSLPSQFPVPLQQSEITPNEFGPNGFIPSRRPPPIPESTNVLSSKFQTRHPDAVRRNIINNSGTTRSNSRMTRISLADSKLRAKPLPPLGPMAPSAIPGVVEIGSTREDPIPRSQLRSKKSFAKFFWKGKKE